MSAPISPAAGSQTTDNLTELVAGLASGNWLKRHDARIALEQLGGTAAGQVAALLQSGDDLARWEAARTLVTIGTPEVAPALADALDDEEPGVRWFAAEALRRLGPIGTIATLRELGRHVGSGWMHEGAHRVLRRSRDPRLTPVLQALEGPFAREALPGPLFEALRELSVSPNG